MFHDELHNRGGIGQAMGMLFDAGFADQDNRAAQPAIAFGDIRKDI